MEVVVGDVCSSVLCLHAVQAGAKYIPLRARGEFSFLVERSFSSWTS